MIHNMNSEKDVPMTYKEIQMVLNAKAREVYYEHF
jgi:hypothetical protein